MKHPWRHTQINSCHETSMMIKQDEHKTKSITLRPNWNELGQAWVVVWKAQQEMRNATVSRQDINRLKQTLRTVQYVTNTPAWQQQRAASTPFRWLLLLLRLSRVSRRLVSNQAAYRWVSCHSAGQGGLWSFLLPGRKLGVCGLQQRFHVADQLCISQKIHNKDLMFILQWYEIISSRTRIRPGCINNS